MNGNSNIDSYLEKQMRLNLESSTRDDFTDKIMNEIELNKKYMIEDKKTFRSVKIIIASFVSLFIVFVFAGVMLIVPSLSVTSFNINNLITRSGDFIEDILIRITDIVGITFSLQSIFFLIIILFSFILFTFSERKLTKKSSSN